MRRHLHGGRGTRRGRFVFDVMMSLCLIGCGGSPDQTVTPLQTTSAPDEAGKTSPAPPPGTTGRAAAEEPGRTTFGGSSQAAPAPDRGGAGAAFEPWGGFEIREQRIPPSSALKRESGLSRPLDIVVQNGHTDHITQIEFNNDGTLVFTASNDRQVKIWNREGVLLRSIPVPAEELRWLAVMPEGDAFWTGDEGAAFRYDLMGRLVDQYADPDQPVRLAAVRPDGGQIATVDAYGTVTLRNERFQPTKTFRAQKYRLTAIAYSPGGEYLVTGGSQGEVESGWRASARVWSLDGSHLADLEVEKPAGIGVAGNGNSETSRQPRDPIETVKSISISRDGRTIALAGDANRVHLWRPDGESIERFEREWLPLEGAEKAVFTPTGQSLIVVLRRSVVKIGLDGRDQGGVTIIPKPDPARIRAFAVSPDGTRMVAGAGEMSNGQPDRLIILDRFGHLEKTIAADTTRFSSVAMSPDRSQIVLGKEYGKASVLFRPPDNTVDAVQESRGFYRDGTPFAFTQDRRFHLSDDRGRRDFNVDWQNHAVPLPDGNLAVVFRGANHRINIFDPNGAPLRTVEYNGHGKGLGVNLAFSPDLSYFAVETDTQHGGVQGVACIGLGDGEPLSTFNVDAPFQKLAIAPDNRTIALGHDNGTITLWTRDGAKTRTLEGHTNSVVSLAFDHSGQYLLSTAEDRTLRLWYLVTGRWVGLVVLDNGEWVAFTPSGRFDCSNGGQDRVRLVRGLEVYEFRQIWDDFFTPGLVDRLLNGAEMKAIDVAGGVDRAPAVTIDLLRAPQAGGVETTATVSVCATPTEGRAGEIFLFHNGRAIDSPARGIKRMTSGECATFDIALTPGKNTFVGAAYDASNIIFGQSRAVEVQYAPRTVSRPDMHILAVGISVYRDSNIALLYPADDARAIAAVLEKNAAGLYGKVNVDVLVNGQATRAAVQQRLDAVAKNAKAADTVILYFAGHGETESGTYYFLGHDADITDLGASALSIDDLGRFARQTAANKIAVFLDTCKSGAATRHIGALAMARSIDERKLIASLAKEQGIAVFSAASADQSAFEIGDLKHGIFTYCMLDYLERRRFDVDSNGLISISKLLSMVSRATRDLAAKHLDVIQTPILYMFGDDFSLGYVR